MKFAIIKLCLSLLVLASLAGAISATENDGWLTAWFILFIFLGLPIFILSWIDLGYHLKELDNPSLLIKFIIIIFATPQALLGLVAFLSGASIIVWVIYNTFIETLPQYRGGILTFGLAPALLLFGLYWLRTAFSRDNHANDDDAD